MSDEPVRTRVRARRRWRAVPGVHDPRARAAAPVEGVELAASSGRAADARGARGDRAPPGDRDRPVQPGDLDRADPAPCPGMREALRAAPAPVVAVSARSSAARSLKGPTDGVHAWAGQPRSTPRHRGRLRAALHRRAGRRRARADGVPVLRRPTCSWPTPPARRARWPTRRSRFAEALRGELAFRRAPCATSPSCPSSASTAPSSASRDGAAARARAARSPRRWCRRAGRAAAASRRSTRSSS